MGPDARHLEQSYRVAGRAAQHAFWGQGDVARLSMLHQLAQKIRMTAVIGAGFISPRCSAELT